MLRQPWVWAQSQAGKRCSRNRLAVHACYQYVQTSIKKIMVCGVSQTYSR